MKTYKLLKNLPYGITSLSPGDHFQYPSAYITVHTSTGEIKFLTNKLIQLGYLEICESNMKPDIKE